MLFGGDFPHNVMIVFSHKPSLFIGTSARKGIASALIGNICERVSDNLSCDVVVITPKAVIRNVPTVNPSKSY